MNGADMPHDDEALLDRLRTVAAEADPPPELTVLAARAAFLTRRLDEELAELVLDSAEHHTSVRSASGDVRVLSFEAGDLTVEVQVQDTATGRELRGLIDGFGDDFSGGTVAIETAERTRDIDVDSDGWFALEALAPGPARLRITRAGAAPVVTSWVVL